MNFMPKRTDKLSLEQKVQLLMDERDIRDVLHRWCRSIDRIDVDLMKTCFHEDAQDHHAPFFDCTAKELAAFLPDGAKGIAQSLKYLIGNVLIDIDGDVARTEALVFGLAEKHEHAQNGDRMLQFGGFRYLDRFERRNGEWRIAERWYVDGAGTEFPVVDSPIGTEALPADVKKMPAPILNKRDRSDQSYLI